MTATTIAGHIDLAEKFGENSGSKDRLLIGALLRLTALVTQLDPDGRLKRYADSVSARKEWLEQQKKLRTRLKKLFLVESKREPDAYVCKPPFSVSVSESHIEILSQGELIYEATVAMVSKDTKGDFTICQFLKTFQPRNVKTFSSDDVTGCFSEVYDRMLFDVGVSGKYRNSGAAEILKKFRPQITDYAFAKTEVLPPEIEEVRNKFQKRMNEAGYASIPIHIIGNSSTRWMKN